MRRYLVVANQALQRAELAEELRKRFEAGPSSFYLLVPDTRAADYPGVAAAAGVLQPGMTWRMTDYRGPATDEQASMQPGNGSARCWLTRVRWVSPSRVTWAVPSLWRPWRRCSPITGSTRSSWPRCPAPSRAGCGPTCPMGRAPVRSAGHGQMYGRAGFALLRHRILLV
jgi:hypothetical protein